MTSSNTKTVRRITVAIDATRRSADTLIAAADIAARISGELTALFVEDVNLCSLAELPFAVELDRTSGVTRRLDPNVVARALEVDVERVRRLLQVESERRQITTSLKVVRGHYVAAAIEATNETDVVVLGTMSGLGLSIPRLTPKGGRPRTQARRAKPVWMLYDGSAAAARALTLARDFTKERDAELVVVIPDDDRYDDSLRKAKKKLEGTPARYQRVRNWDAVELFKNIVTEGCMLCVLPRTTSALIEQLPAAWLDRLACPVVVVS